MGEKYRLAPSPFYPRLYLDTNVLIDAILETDPKKNERINTSKAILYSWKERVALGGGLNVSPYVIGEFISKGQKEPFKKSFSEMIELVENHIRVRCKILYTSFSLEDISSLNPKWNKGWMLAKKQVRGMGIILETKEKVGIFDFEMIWNMTLNEIPSFGGRFPLEMDISEIMRKNYHIIPEDIRSGSIQAPAFEILLFNMASELAIKYKIHLSDSIHFLYSKRKDVDIIVSNDKKFRKRWESIDPKLKTRLEIKSSKEIVERFYEINKDNLCI